MYHAIIDFKPFALEFVVFSELFSSKKKRTMPGASKDLHTVFVRNIPYDYTSKQLKELAESKIGENSVKLATVVMDSEKGESKGYGFVEFKLISDANKAPKQLNGLEIQGRKLMVKPFMQKNQRLNCLILHL